MALPKLTHKVCRICEVDLPIDQFARSNSDGSPHHTCNPCRASWQERRVETFRQRRIDNFWKRVDKTSGPNGCWLWLGPTSDGGYGRIRMGERGDRTRVYTHRFVWEITNGPIPEGKLICHDCPGGGNPACVNPAHLYVGSHGDNMRDTIAQGRWKWSGAHGTQMKQSNLTEDDVREIRRLYESGESGPSIAKQYGLSNTTIYGIANRKYWKHVA